MKKIILKTFKLTDIFSLWKIFIRWNRRFCGYVEPFLFPNAPRSSQSHPAAKSIPSPAEYKSPAESDRHDTRLDNGPIYRRYFQRYPNFAKSSWYFWAQSHVIPFRTVGWYGPKIRFFPICRFIPLFGSVTKFFSKKSQKKTLKYSFVRSVNIWQVVKLVKFCKVQIKFIFIKFTQL